MVDPVDVRRLRAAQARRDFGRVLLLQQLIEQLLLPGQALVQVAVAGGVDVDRHRLARLRRQRAAQLRVALLRRAHGLPGRLERACVGLLHGGLAEGAGFFDGRAELLHLRVIGLEDRALLLVLALQPRLFIR